MRFGFTNFSTTLANSHAELFLNVPASEAQDFADLAHRAHAMHRSKYIRRITQKGRAVAGKLDNAKTTAQLLLKTATDVAWHGIRQVRHNPGHDSGTDQQ